MGKEKIEQNVERIDKLLTPFLFHTLGCDKKTAIKIIKKYIKEKLAKK